MERKIRMKRSVLFMALGLVAFRYLFPASWQIPLPALIAATLLFFLTRKRPFFLLFLILCLWSQWFVSHPPYRTHILRENVTVTGFWWEGEFDWRTRVIGEKGERAVLTVRTDRDPSAAWFPGKVLHVTGSVDTVPRPGFQHWPSRPRQIIRVKSPILVEERETAWWGVFLAPVRVNNRLARRLHLYSHTYPEACGVAGALILGRIWEMGEEEIRLFRHSGLMHLLAISGFHVGLILALLYLLLLPFRLSPNRMTSLLLVIFTLYPVFTGFRPPVVRAGLMILIYLASLRIARPIRGGTILLFSLIITSVLMPETVRTPGFTFTYCATGFLYLMWKERPSLKHYLAAVFCLPVYLLPLQGYYFRTITLLSGFLTPLITLWLIPLLPLAAIATLAPCPATLEPLSWVSQALTKSLSFLVHRCWWGSVIPKPSLFLTLAALFTVTFLLIKKRERWFRPMIPVAVWLLLLGLVPRPWPGLIGVDVGEGLAMIFKDCQQGILVDTGYGPAGYNLLPTLSDAGLTDLSAVVLTHSDTDHTGAFRDLAREMRVGTVLLPEGGEEGWANVLELANIKGIPVRRLHSGMGFAGGRWSFTVLWPPKGLSSDNDNDSGLVLFARGPFDVLVTGDASTLVEMKLLSSLTPAEVLQVGHHGSRSSTSNLLLDAVRPSVALISCGRRNPFRHPHPALIKRLENRNILVKRTDIHGNVYVRKSSILRIWSSRAFRSLTSW